MIARRLTGDQDSEGSAWAAGARTGTAPCPSAEDRVRADRLWRQAGAFETKNQWLIGYFLSGRGVGTMLGTAVCQVLVAEHLADRGQPGVPAEQLSSQGVP
jgi:hypothetical protein